MVDWSDSMGTLTASGDYRRGRGVVLAWPEAPPQ